MSRRVGCYSLLLALLPVPADAEERMRRDAYGDPLPPRSLVRLGTRHLRHDAFLIAAAYSPDGKRVAAVSYCGDLVLWDLASGKALYRLSGPRSDCRLLFSPDGKWLAVTGWGYRTTPMFQILEAETGRELARDLRGGNPALAFSADSKAAASVRDGHTVVMWDLPSGKEKSRSQALPGSVKLLAFNRDGGVLALAPKGDAMALWDAGSGEQLSTFPRPGAAKTFAAALSPNRKYIALGGTDAFLALYDLSTGEELRRLRGHEGSVVWHLAFSPDGQSLCSGDNSANTIVWEAASGKKKWQQAHTPGMGTFAPDGKTLTTFGANGPHGLQFLDAATGKEIRPFAGHLSMVSTVAFSPDGSQVLTSDWMRSDPAALLWDARSGKVIREFRGHPPGVGSAVFSPDGRRVATSAFWADSTVRLWDTATGRELRKFIVDSPANATHAVFSPNGKWLAAYRQCRAGPNGPVIWDVDSGKVVRQIDVPREQNVCALAFTPDGKTLVRGGVDGLQMWDASSGAELPGLRGNFQARSVLNRVWRLAFSPDGRWLATVSDGVSGGWGQLWEMVTRRPILELPDGAAVAFSPDGRFVAIALREKHVLLCEAASGAECLRLTVEAEGVVSLAFSPDGTRLISGNRDSTALVWDVSDLPNRVPRKPAPPADPKALGDRWAALQGDAPAAHRAMTELVAAGRPAVRYLGERLAAARIPDPRLLAKLIRDLDADDFKTREAASKHLREWGTDAEDALRRALRDQPTPEQKKRLEALLAARAASPGFSEEVRSLRAIAVLERIGSPEARAALRTLLKESNETLRNEAKTSLERLARRDHAAP